MPITDADQLRRRLLSTAPLGDGRYAASEGGVRDPKTLRAYHRVAPAVVLVTDERNGHGTGFFVRDDGSILTNHHVIADLPYDPIRGTRTATIVYGRIDSDGAMSPAEARLQAEVYRSDERSDLALLKLIDATAPDDKFPTVEFASSAPAPGATCLAIGHPSAGVMWTLRTGSIAGRGTFPDDQIVEGFAAGLSKQQKEKIARSFEESDRCKVLLSTCGLNPGDSGGPLLDEEGRLIAVSFAVPTIDADRGVDLGKFSYHIHLDEVQRFLADWPTEPEILPPSHLPDADVQAYADLDSDSVPETLVFFRQSGREVVGYLVDLDQDSAGVRAEKGKGGKRKTNKLASKEPTSAWDFEYAVNLDDPQARFVDRNNDGEIDLVVIGNDESTLLILERDGERWKRRDSTSDFDEDTLFSDPAIGRRYAEFLELTTKSN
jgi:S1-C subfamily serine protease